MIIKDLSTFLDEKGEIPLVERIRGTFRFGSNWYGDVQAQEVVISRLQDVLSDDFMLLRNLIIPGLDVPIPIILIGPPGIQVIYTSALKGIYQAKGEQWNEMNTYSRRFRAARPNLINRLLLLTRAVKRHLERFGYQNLNIEPVMIFTDLGIHVDTKSPATRIVMIDALDRYAVSMAQLARVIKAEDVIKITKLLTTPAPGAEGMSAEEEQLIQEAFALRRAEASPGRSRTYNLPFLGALRFTTRQWILLGFMVLIDIIVLAGLIILTLFYS